MTYIAIIILVFAAYVAIRLWWALRNEWTDIEPPE